MIPEKLLGKVQFKQRMSENVYLVRLGFEREVHYLPGQYVSLKVSEEGMRRSYSVASLPNKDVIDLLVDVSPMGVGSKFILGLKVGDEVEVMLFLGNFVMNDEQILSAKRVLFVATGTGIAPIKPMIEDLLYNKNFPGEVRLVWGMRKEDDLYWLKEFENINRDFDRFRLDVVLSRPEREWPGYRGHVEVVLNSLGDVWDEALVYLCGSTQMMEETEKLLESNGVPKERIFYEKYY